MKLDYFTRFQHTEYFYKLKVSTYKLQKKGEEIRTQNKNVLQKFISPSLFCLPSNIFDNNWVLYTYFDSLVFISLFVQLHSIASLSLQGQQ